MGAAAWATPPECSRRSCSPIITRVGTAISPQPVPRRRRRRAAPPGRPRRARSGSCRGTVAGRPADPARGAGGPSSQTRASSPLTVVEVAALVRPRPTRSLSACTSGSYVLLRRPADRRADQDERAHPLGVGEREVERASDRPSSSRPRRPRSTSYASRTATASSTLDQPSSRLVRRPAVAARVVGQAAVVGQRVDDVRASCAGR